MVILMDAVKKQINIIDKLEKRIKLLESKLPIVPVSSLI